MELRIKITKENKDRIFELISNYLEEELDFILPSPSISPSQSQSYSHKTPVRGDYLTIPPDIQNLVDGSVITYGNKEDNRINLVGSWGQFNSFFPIKAALRILANTLVDNEVFKINFREYVYTCIDIFDKTRIRNKALGKFRGFPRKKKDTAIGRFVWHFITPAHEMGLFSIHALNENHIGIPHSPNDWSKVNIGLTKEGLHFAQLDNPLFDRSEIEQVLDYKETIWLIDFLQKVDKEGFREFSLLKDVYDFINRGNNGKNDLWNWFEEDERFMKYIKSWSRKSENPKELQLQVKNLSKTYSASKIALLRELGLIKNKRGDYSIIKTLEGV